MMNNIELLLEWENIEMELDEAFAYILDEETIISESGYSGLGHQYYAGFRSAINSGIGAGSYVGRTAGRAVKEQIGKSASAAKNFGATMANAASRIANNPLVHSKFWEVLVEKLKMIWQKFKNVISALFKSNQRLVQTEIYNIKAIVRKALEDPELGNKVNLFEIKNVYPYWKKHNIILKPLPHLNMRDRQMLDSLMDKNAFVSKYLRDYIAFDFSMADVGQYLLDALRGAGDTDGAKSMQIYEILPYIDIMLEWVKDIKGQETSLEREQNTIISAAEEAVRRIQSSGVENASNIHNATDANINNRMAEMIANDLTAVRNYISVVQTIQSVRMTIVKERSEQTLRIMREILMRCGAASSADIGVAKNKDNVKDEYTAEQKAKREEFDNKTYEGKNMFDRAKKNRNKRADTRDQLSSKFDEKMGGASKLVIDKNYMDSLGDNPKKIDREIKDLKNRYDDIRKFILRNEITRDTDEFRILYGRMEDYKRKMRTLDARKKELAKESTNNKD